MTIQSQAEPTALYYTYLHHEKLQKRKHISSILTWLHLPQNLGISRGVEIVGDGEWLNFSTTYWLNTNNPLSIFLLILNHKRNKKGVQNVYWGTVNNFPFWCSEGHWQISEIYAGIIVDFPSKWMSKDFLLGICGARKLGVLTFNSLLRWKPLREKVFSGCWKIIQQTITVSSFCEHMKSEFQDWLDQKGRLHQFSLSMSRSDIRSSVLHQTWAFPPLLSF